MVDSFSFCWLKSELLKYWLPNSFTMIQIEIIVVSIVVEVQVLSNVYIEMSAHRNSLFERTVIKHAVTDQNTYAKYIITDKNILSLFIWSYLLGGKFFRISSGASHFCSLYIITQNNIHCKSFRKCE